MNFDTNIINRHIFSEGNIQASPAEIVLLNSKSPSLFKPRYINSPIDAGYRLFLSGYANKIFQNELKLSYGRILEASINSLRSNARPVSGFRKKALTDTRLIESQFHSIWYKIHSGQILVYNIELKNSLQKARDSLEGIGAYI